jgi:hypothetical protein
MHGPRNKMVKKFIRNITKFVLTFKRFVQPLLQWKSNKYYILWVCVCSLGYPSCNAHASYCHLCPDPFYIFLLYLINTTIYKKVTEHAVCEFRVSLQRLSKTFFIFRRNERDIIENVYWSPNKLPLILVRF